MCGSEGLKIRWTFAVFQILVQPQDERTRSVIRNTSDRALSSRGFAWWTVSPNGLKHRPGDREISIGDSGYGGTRFIAPPSWQDWVVPNTAIARARHETLNRRLKSRSVLGITAWFTTACMLLLWYSQCYCSRSTHFPIFYSSILRLWSCSPYAIGVK